ncbi:hypothetical protein KKE03_05035 [Patescibacteria group bacterium]|nr:hypothetical protein [Patescibacteria group bacterium]
MPELLENPIGLILIVVATAAIFLYLREYNKRRKLEVESDKFLQSLKEKGWETLHQSIKKSQDILATSELEGIKVVADQRLKTEKSEEEFLNQSKQTIISAQNRLLAFMQDLQKRSAEFEEAQKATGEARINQLFDRVETQLADFLVQTAQKTTSSIELELKSTRHLIDTYKSEQLKLIDENIVAMMEQTLDIVLAKKLTLKDQLDLIYEALEKAKVDKFVV